MRSWACQPFEKMHDPSWASRTLELEADTDLKNENGFVHIDPVEERRPLPLVEDQRVDEWSAELASDLMIGRCSVTDSKSTLTVELTTDSSHLFDFFTNQWPAALGVDEESSRSDARILALVHEPDAYGISGASSGIRYVRPDRRVILSFGNEYYGNVKVSTRGLCAAISADSDTGMFVHGSALSIEDKGVLIGGASGAGKTTTTAALRSMASDVQLVNDDYGPASVEHRMLTFAGEQLLHMKYRSVLDLRPDARLAPHSHLSENYCGDPQDPHARLLIDPEEVFGEPCRNAAEWKMYVVVTRDTTERFFARPLRPSDISMIEKSQYSAFYDRHEHFLDGSLLHLSDEHLNQTRSQYENVLAQIPGIVVNNTGRPEEAAEAVLLALGEF